MKIMLNNKEEIFDGEILTINELLQAKKFTFKMLVINVNETMVKRSEYDTKTIVEGDDVMVLHLVSGG